MDLKTINKRIKLIGTNYGKINAYVQETAVGVLEHAQEHGDCTPALRLVQAMPASARRGLLINWFGTFSPIGMNVKQGKVGFHKPGSKAYNPFNLEGARITNWFETAEAKDEDLPDTTLDDVRTALDRLAKRFQSKLDNGDVAANDVDAVRRTVAAVTELRRVA